MPQSLAQIYLHLVFSTKNSEPILSDRLIREEVFTYLGGVCNALDCPVVVTGGFVDHTHVFCRMGRSITIADLVRELKRESSKWIKERFENFKSFHWQAGYGAFSVSPAHVSLLEGYIQNQESHHANETFQEEFRRLLTKYGLQWDERYVWD